MPLFLPIDMTKNELRKKLRERRGAIPADRKKQYDQAIVDHVMRSELFQHASMVLLYAPVGSEVSIVELRRLCRDMGKPVAFPRCDTETETMQFYLLRPEDKLRKSGAYGIPEPLADAPLCVPDEHALCIVPALSFDLFGNRIGYGKGYYDKYLSTFPGVTMGVLYSETMVKRIPTDEHDLPVDCMVTENGLLLPLHDEQKKEAPKKAASAFWNQRALPVLRRGAAALLRFIESAKEMKEEGGVRPLHAPMVLVLSTFLMLLFSRGVETKFLDRGNEYIGVILLEILIFLIPAILYCKLRSTRFVDRVRPSPLRPSHLPLLLLLLLLMTTGSMLTSILTGGIRALEGNFTLYNTFTSKTSEAVDVLYSILAYALLPALGEELIYRSILCTEYEKYGVGVSITVSSLCFAMLHFSFENFLTYFFLGVILASAMYATRTLLAPFLLHFCYNIFCLFGQPYLSSFYVHAGSNEIFLFLLVVLFLLAAAFTAGEARKIYHIYATRCADSSYTTSVPLRQYPKRILVALFSPVFAAAVLFWLILAIINLF